MLSIAGILLALAALMYFAYRGVSVLLLAPLCALVAVLASGAPLLASYTQVFMPALGGFVTLFFPLFLLGAVFGKLMEASGAARALALALVGRLGPARALPAVVGACALLTYGGVSLFVVAFAVFPVAAELFRTANLPRRLIPGAIALGAFSFTMSALPGTPAIQNAIPMPFFGTTPFAAPGLGIIAAIVWPGGRADHAIWFAVPLAGLVAVLLHTLLLADDPVNRVYYPAPYWARWVLALAVFGLLLAIASAFQGIGQALLTAPGGDLAGVVWDVPTVVLFMVTLLFIVVAFFMAGSLWDNRTALRGIGLGVAAFGLLTSLGAGWNAAVPYGDRAAELWRLQAVQRDNFLLRQTLLKVAKREAGGSTELPVTVLAAQNGAVAWAVRDFPNAEFITDLTDAVDAPVLLVGSGLLPSQTGVPYVGQDFAQVHFWSPAVLFTGDIVAYWTQGLTRSALTGLANTELWLRQDIYDGVDPADLPRG